MPFYKRCNFYYDSGKPRRTVNGTFGCKRYETGQCRFVHPDEDLWDKAASSNPPPSSFLYEDYYQHSSPVHRNSSVDRHRSPSTDVFGPPRPPPTAPKRTRSSSSHRDISLPRRDSMSHSRRSRSPIGSTSSRDPGSAWRPITSSKIPPRSPRRDEKAPVEPLAPPPPLPPSPSIATGITSSKEPPAADKREAWLERIKLISDSTKYRTDHVKLEGELRHLRFLKQSLGFAGLSKDDKSLITTQLSEVEKQCEDKKLKLNEMVAKLMETNYWPLLRAPDIQRVEEKYEDLKKIVTDLKDVVTKVNNDLRLIVADRNLGGAPGEQAMDVDQRPAKRRRIDDDEEIGVFQGGIQGHTTEEFEQISDRLMNLESRLTDVSNDLTQRDADIMDEIVSAVDAKWEDAGPPPVPVPDPQNPEDLGKLQQIEQNLNGTGTDVVALAEEVGKLMTREPEIAIEIQQLREENAKIRDNCAAYETNLHRMREQMERDKKATEALSAALAVHLAHPPSPPPSPTSLPQEYILQILDEPIQDSVRAHIKHLLERLRTDVENMMRAKNDELYGTLWGKLTLTLKMVDAIARKVNQESGDPAP